MGWESALSSYLGYRGAQEGAAAAEHGINAQYELLNRSLDMQQQMYDESVANMQPFLEAGQAALVELQNQPAHSLQQMTAENQYFDQQLNLPSTQYGVNPQNAFVNPDQYSIDPMTGLPSANINAPNAQNAFVDPSQYQVDPNTGLPTSASINTQLDPNDPIYQFRMQQAQEAASAELAKQGLTGSSAAVERRADVASQVAAAESDRQVQRAENEFARQMGLSGEQYGRAAEQASNLYGRTAEQAANLYARQYGAVTDQFGREFNVGQAGYQRQAQQAEAGYQRAAEQQANLYARQLGLEEGQYARQMSQNAARQQWYGNVLNAANQQEMIDYQRQLDLIRAGQGGAGSIGAWGVGTGGNMANSYSNAAAGVQSGYNAIGAAWNNFYNNQAAQQQYNQQQGTAAAGGFLSYFL